MRLDLTICLFVLILQSCKEIEGRRYYSRKGYASYGTTKAQKKSNDGSLETLSSSRKEAAKLKYTVSRLNVKSQVGKLIQSIIVSLLKNLPKQNAAKKPTSTKIKNCPRPFSERHLRCVYVLPSGQYVRSRLQYVENEAVNSQRLDPPNNQRTTNRRNVPTSDRTTSSNTQAPNGMLNREMQNSPQLQTAGRSPNPSTRQQPAQTAVLPPNPPNIQQPVQNAVLSPNSPNRQQPAQTAVLSPNLPNRQQPVQFAVLSPNPPIRQQPPSNQNGNSQSQIRTLNSLRETGWYQEVSENQAVLSQVIAASRNSQIGRWIEELARTNLMEEFVDYPVAFTLVTSRELSNIQQQLILTLGGNDMLQELVENVPIFAQILNYARAEYHVRLISSISETGDIEDLIANPNLLTQILNNARTASQVDVIENLTRRGYLKRLFQIPNLLIQLIQNSRNPAAAQGIINQAETGQLQQLIDNQMG